MAPAVRDVVLVMGMRSPFAATSNVCSLLSILSLCPLAIFSLMIVFAHPVSGVANMRKAAPVCSCASQRSRGGAGCGSCHVGIFWWQFFCVSGYQGFVARCRSCKVTLFLIVTAGPASTFAHLGHVTLFVALGTCHIFAFDFTDVLFVRAPAPCSM